MKKHSKKKSKKKQNHDAITYQKYGAQSNQQIMMKQQNMIPQQNMMYSYQNPFSGIQFVYVQNPLLELESCPQIFVKQQPEYIKKLFGCEVPNIYHIFGYTQQGFRYLFKCKEKSDWFMRNCCPAINREFNMEILHILPTNLMDNFAKPFVNAYKPYSISMCCLFRPEIFLTLSEGNAKIGTVYSLFSLCTPEFEVYDGKDQLKYIATANCCQFGLLCSKSFCGKLSEALFEIHNPKNMKVIGTITKQCANFAELFTDADSYVINFPINANAYDKLLIIALSLLIDYKYFESGPSDKKGGRRRRRI